jgi:toxin ParE1/3/4
VKRYLLSPAAKEDIDGIGVYSTVTWGEEQSDLYLKKVFAKFDKIVAKPALGRFYDHVRGGYRRVKVERHLIFYKITDQEIVIVRILHEKLDSNLHL